MKKLLPIIILIFISCESFNKKEIETENVKKEKLTSDKPKDSEKYKWIHEFKSELDENLGDLYVKQVNDSIFNSMIILKEKDTIYKIDKLDFWNKNGIDFDIPKNTKGFYGYSIPLLGKNQIVLRYYTNSGQNVADDQTLYFDFKEKVFQIMVAP